MALYIGIDLHSTNGVVAILDHTKKRIAKARLKNHMEEYARFLEPFKKEIVGIAIESTYNWYWIVDFLMELGYKVHLANPAAMQQYTGIKHCDDVHDAFWLAHMLLLGILPEGHIYAREDRPVRDLARKRIQLVQVRSSQIISLKNTLARNGVKPVSTSAIKKRTEDLVAPVFEPFCDDLRLCGAASKALIDFLTTQITQLEKVIQERIRLRPAYRHLLSVYGIGKILALTIMLETGPIDRFPTVGDYVSYCRKVKADRISNGKKKGSGNKKNGNRYLAWAFSEAAEAARRHYRLARSFYDRKLHQRGSACAHQALARKLARATYYVLRDQVPFDPKRLFHGKQG